MTVPEPITLPPLPTNEKLAEIMRRHFPRTQITNGFRAIMLDAIECDRSRALADASQASEVVLDMPEDDAVHEAWVTACEVDGIKYSGSAFERGYELALSNGDPEWPDWAHQVLKITRKHSGYDGYDDQDGVDIVEEVSECMRELAAMADRARAALAATSAPTVVPDASKAVVGEASDYVSVLEYSAEEIVAEWGKGFESGFESGKKHGAKRAALTHSPAPSAAPQGADALREAGDD